LALIAALISFSTISCFAESVFLSVNSTPYDRQMTRIQPVLFTKSTAHKDGFSPQWKTPAEVEAATFADCKGKAVALYQKMSSSGAQNVRLVIGRRTSTSRKTHAWLEWNTDSGSYVLDPTINWSAYRTAEVDSHSYIPLYAYAGSRKYRAAAGTLVAKN